MFTCWASLLLFSCAKEDISKNTNASLEAVSVSNGHLKFASNNAFKEFVEKAGAYVNKLSILKSTKFNSFISLDQKGGFLKGSNDGEIQEVDSLIPDDLFRSILDTARVVEVANTVYKITKYGTFIVKAANSFQLNETIQNFPSLKSQLTQVCPGLYKLNDSIHVFDTYNYISGDTLHADEPINKKKGGLVTNASYTKTYNLTNYTLGGGTLVDRSWNWLWGGDTKYLYFDDDHRATVKLYDYNYLIYKSTGFHVEMQKWNGWPYFGYWGTTSAQTMVIGVEDLKAHINDFYHGRPLPPTGEQFTTQYGNSAASLVYTGFQSLKLPITGWVSDAVPEFDISVTFPFGLGSASYNDNKLISDLKSGIDNQIKSAIYNFTRGVVNKNPVILPSSPKVGYGSYPSDNNLQIYLAGITSINDMRYRDINLGRSFGITVGYGGGTSGINVGRGFTVGSFTPNVVSIDYASIFGAVYFNNKWKGARLILQ